MKRADRITRVVFWTLWLGCAGEVLAVEPILTLSGSAGKALTAPTVAFNPIDGRFLAAYEYHYGATDWDIDGRIVDANGRLVGSSGMAIAWNGTIVQQEPDLAYNPLTDQFLMVYALAPDNWKISACLISGKGTPGSFVPIATSTYREYDPAAACDPLSGEYLVAYEREYQLDNAVWREIWTQRGLQRTASRVPGCVSDPDQHERLLDHRGGADQYAG
jgi:hypothetical protein